MKSPVASDLPSARTLKAFIVITLLLVLAGGVSFYLSQEQAIQESIAKNLRTIARSKAEQITEWRRERVNDAAVLSANPFFIRAVSQYRQHRNPVLAEDLLHLFQSIHAKQLYDAILLVDPDGKMLLSLNGKDRPHQAFTQQLTLALRERRPVFIDLHRDAQEKTPHLSIIAPLFAENSSAGEPLGAVIMVCDAARFLYPVIEHWPTASETSETYIVRPEGDDVLFLNNLRNQPDTALTFRLPLRNSILPAAMAASGREGIVHGRDYRGIEVVAALQPIPDSPWFMVVKIDAAEVYASWRLRSVLILSLISGLIAMICIAGFLMRQREKKAHFRALYLSERALRESLERQSVALRAIGDAVIATDAQGRVEVMNPTAEELTGWKEAEARNQPLTDVFTILNERTRARVTDPVSRVLDDGASVNLANHTILVARDGTERPIADSGAPIRDEDGSITGVVLVFRDQSAQRAAEEALRESETRYRTLFEASADGILIADVTSTKFRYANPAICNLLGYTVEEFARMRVENLHPPDVLPRAMEEFEAQARGEKTLAENIPCLRKDGTIVYVDVNAAPITVNGRPCNVGFFRDITQRKQAEEEQNKLQAQLYQAQKLESVGRLAGGVAHDFNNMLGVILGNAEMALNNIPADHPLSEDLKEIHAAAKRSADITRQLLAFARKQTISPRVIDLNETVGATLKMLRRLIGEDIDLAWMPGSDVWPVMLDSSQLDQILANLCVNARDAISGVGKITIETGNVSRELVDDSDAPGSFVGDFALLAVSDDGCGMDRETLDRIFEPFFTSKEIGKGTGLGLATVYGIVKQNNGFIHAYSEPGKGSTFRIYLPRHKSEAGETISSEYSDIPAGNGETVLLVEDDPALLALAARILRSLGYSVLAAATPSQALSLATDHPGPLDLLLTDVVIPEMNGRELAERLQIQYPELKVLFMSGYTANVIAHHGVLEEGIHFIQKPFSKRNLAEKMRDVLFHKKK